MEHVYAKEEEHYLLVCTGATIALTDGEDLEITRKLVSEI